MSTNDAVRGCAFFGMLGSLVFGQPVSLQTGVLFSEPGQPVAPLVSFDQGWAPTSVTFTESETDSLQGSGYNSQFLADISVGNVNVLGTSLWYVANSQAPGMASPVRYNSFRGDKGLRGTMSMNWGSADGVPFGLINNPGADAAIFEWSNNEGFAVRLQLDTLVWSPWIYTSAQVAFPVDTAPPVVNGNAITMWGTLLEFDNFGIPAGGKVITMEIYSLLATDVGTEVSPGSGAFELGSGSALINPQTGSPFGNAGVPFYSAGTDLTADIWYVTGLAAPVPEPASILLLAGLLPVIARLRSAGQIG